MATDDTITVTINVGNLDEAGTVTLSGTPARALRQLTAMLERPRTAPQVASTWQWSRSVDQDLQLGLTSLGRHPLGTRQ